MSLYVLIAVLLARSTVILCDYKVTVYPQVHKVGHLTQFDPDRWNGKNGLDGTRTLPLVRGIGAIAARWPNNDLRYHIFEKAPEDPHRKGYPSPTYFHTLHNFTEKYIDNMKGYGNPEIVMDLQGETWPHWIDRSEHKGHFPNNIDSAAEFAYLVINAVSRDTNGKLPLFFEVINEPSEPKLDVNWTSMVSYHKAVAEKLKSKFPHLRVGGPTYNGAATAFDKRDFRVWNRIAQFLDMALGHLGFFSFHSYIPMDVKGGNHEFRGNSEAKLFGLIDLIDSYAHKKVGKSIDVIVSEFGLGPISGVDIQKPSGFVDWAHIYQHNAQRFTFLERRDVMRKIIAYFITYDTRDGQSGINHSLLDKNNNVRDVAQAYRFWKNIHKNMTYLRVESQFHGAERKIVPHALVDKSTGLVTVLLHNHDTKPTQVTLGFNKGWFNPGSGKSTCEYLSPQRKPILESGKPIHVTNSVVTVPAEASCAFQFHSSNDFTHAPLLTEKTFYSKDMVIAIHNIVDVKVNIPTLGNVEFAHLRFGVSLTDKSAKPKPKMVKLNKHPLTSFYSLQTTNSPSDATVWQSYVYKVPVSILKANNDVNLVFEQHGGYVTTVAIVIGHL